MYVFIDFRPFQNRSQNVVVAVSEDALPASPRRHTLWIGAIWSLPE
jgi:hypothetical protein